VIGEIRSGGCGQLVKVAARGLPVGRAKVRAADQGFSENSRRFIAVKHNMCPTGVVMLLESFEFSFQIR
jgi:hypothetical protein